MTTETRTRIVAKLTSLEMLKKFSPAQLKTLTNDFEEPVVCQILSSLKEAGEDEIFTTPRYEIQKQELVIITAAWQACHCCGYGSLGEASYDAEMPEYFTDYDIVLTSGEEITVGGLASAVEPMPVSAEDERFQTLCRDLWQQQEYCEKLLGNLTNSQSALEDVRKNYKTLEQDVARYQKLEAENCQLKEELAEMKHQLDETKKLSAKVAGMTGQEELDKLIYKYLQRTKKKDVKKRGYIKMTIMELVNTAKLMLSDETQQLLDVFDDDVVNVAKDGADDNESVLAYARMHPLAPYVYVATKAKAVISWLQNEVNTEAKAKEQLAPIRAAIDYSVIRKDAPYETVKKELGLTVSEDSFKNWVKGSRPKEFFYEAADLSGYNDQIRDFMQR